MGPFLSPEPPVVVGVCHVSARVTRGSRPEDLVLSVTMTNDVTSGHSASAVVTGVEAACQELRRWAAAMCASSSGRR